MADADLIDQRGVTEGVAKEQHPQLNTALPAASQELPTGDEIVRAQTEDEVEAQINGTGPDA